MRRGQRLVGLLWRWHRRTGVLIFVFLLLLAVTGIALNHSPGLGLDRRFVQWQWLLNLYGDDSGKLRAFPVDGRWLSRSAGGVLYLDSSAVGSCRGDLVGAVATAELLVVACAEELLLLSHGGELIENVTAGTGLPAPLAGIGSAAGDVLVEVELGWRVADLDALDFTAPAQAGDVIQQQSGGRLPAVIAAAIPAGERWLTWERVLLDLHSGRLGGRPGVWLVDAVGVLLIGTASGGLIMWWLHRRRRGRSVSSSN